VSERHRARGRKHPSDVALVCRNGHLVLGSIQQLPQCTQPFCEDCGAPTIDCCQSCQWPIEGFGQYAWMGNAGPYRPPKYCGQCGTAFPWTEAAIAAAKEYTDELAELNTEEKITLKETFPDLTIDSARTPVALSRFRKLLDKVGPAAGKGLVQIIVSVATDEVKRQFGLR
jgi:hypothetical protein